ncbi:MAG: alpha-L-rhamnosidase, partial [Pseudobutyrivibrio sp.]|nr:alpha-L-rhamnosidase [Pseudobutyrivibrio sp.]
GLPYVIQSAAKYGMNDLICKCITREEHPSYYAFILAGETTLGEYWESNPRSHCHDMMGHIIEWYYNSMAGIKPLEPGFKRVLIEPYLPESMNQLQCSYNSINGEISVRLERIDGKVSVDVKVADGIQYELSYKNL